MLCSDTSGTLPAIHLDREVIELAKELHPIIKSIGEYPEGSIMLKVQHGWVSAIDFTARKFRKKRDKSA